jgi:hypothetical protein
MLAIWKAADGACAQFTPTAKVGVVPAGFDHPISQDQRHVFAALGKAPQFTPPALPVQRGTGDRASVKVEVVRAKVHLFPVFISVVLAPPVVSTASVAPEPITPNVAPMVPLLEAV